MSKYKTVITVTVDPDVLQKFDQERELVPRSTAIEALMRGFNEKRFGLSNAFRRGAEENTK